MYQRIVKRLLDVSLASILLIITAPFSLIIALLIKYESPGPVFFRQDRTGLDGKTFTMRKFRSMSASNDVRDLSKKDEVTKIGRIMRALSLDEIPQLINIIEGDMSFIGPRPWIPEYYQHMNKTQRRRNDVRPGITGLAQAYGRNRLTIHEKIAYDLEYVKDISLKEDMKIILITVRTLLKTTVDEDTLQIGKNGIRNEIDVLRGQNTDGLVDGAS
ncbi:sugar transferase [Streptomyces caniscabiei]|uniref:sugar transferase n=1 Tax=Streptomyces caniscabiei TaxID=2746961 RepID=UPI0029B51F72|nr:sugar transferase [Streptomyces caniscabiei]MDX2776125.1 sugar transferase [Streptomyces caniscabiei]